MGYGDIGENDVLSTDNSQLVSSIFEGLVDGVSVVGRLEEDNAG
jgi:hypothetical protein